MKTYKYKIINNEYHYRWHNPPINYPHGLSFGNSNYKSFGYYYKGNKKGFWLQNNKFLF